MMILMVDKDRKDDLKGETIKGDYWRKWNEWGDEKKSPGRSVGKTGFCWLV